MYTPSCANPVCPLTTFPAILSELSLFFLQEEMKNRIDKHVRMGVVQSRALIKETYFLMILSVLQS